MSHLLLPPGEPRERFSIEKSLANPFIYFNRRHAEPRKVFEKCSNDSCHISANENFPFVGEREMFPKQWHACKLFFRSLPSPPTPLCLLSSYHALRIGELASRLRRSASCHYYSMKRTMKIYSKDEKKK